MPSRSINSSNFSGVHFNESPPIESAPVTTNILAPTLKHRSAPHFTSSVAPGNERQNFRSCSMFILSCLVPSLSQAFLGHGTCCKHECYGVLFTDFPDFLEKCNTV